MRISFENISPARQIKGKREQLIISFLTSLFVTAPLRRFAFESLQIGKSPSSCVYENTSFQEPAVNLYLGQAA